MDHCKAVVAVIQISLGLLGGCMHMSNLQLIQRLLEDRPKNCLIIINNMMLVFHCRQTDVALVNHRVA